MAYLARRLAYMKPLTSQCMHQRSTIYGVYHLRSITNATKPDYIPDLSTVKRVEAKPGGWHPTLVHSSGEVKFTVIRLQSGGGEVPIHHHSKVWDYFMPMEGEAVIETETKDGVKKDYEMKPGSFLAVPAGDSHRVRNTSEDKEFVFFIAQSPRHEYDFIGQ
jgi:mannose-6-phosphate isomerase-like protein (cupin superfamily)